MFLRNSSRYIAISGLIATTLFQAPLFAVTLPGPPPPQEQTAPSTSPQSTAQMPPSQPGTPSSTPSTPPPQNIVIQIPERPPQPPHVPPISGSLSSVVVNTPTLRMFLLALRVADLGDILQDPGPYTVFAPSDAAFKRLPPGTFRFLMGLNNRARLISILTYHIVPGRFMAADLEGAALMTLNGVPLHVTARGTEIYINNAKIIHTNLVGTNGVLHIINHVLFP